MITNQRQYRITKAQAARLREALAEAGQESTELDPRLRQAMRDGLDSQLQTLQQELDEYESLRSGRPAVFELHSLTELPQALIRGRIAAGLSQRQLAERLGLREQQVQRYESSGYAGVSLERAQAVANALGLRLQERVTLPEPTSREREPFGGRPPLESDGSSWCARHVTSRRRRQAVTTGQPGKRCTPLGTRTSGTSKPPAAPATHPHPEMRTSSSPRLLAARPPGRREYRSRQNPR